MIESIIRNRANEIRNLLGVGIPVDVDQICTDIGIKLYERGNH